MSVHALSSSTTTVYAPATLSEIREVVSPVFQLKEYEPSVFKNPPEATTEASPEGIFKQYDETISLVSKTSSLGSFT